jgi:hypothetical protein
MAMQVIRANTGIEPDEIDAFIDTVRVIMPEDYTNRSDLERNLVEMKDAYMDLRLIAERYNELNQRFAEGMEDGTMTSGELDRVTYGIGQCIARFLPTYVEVPYAASLIGTPQCLGQSGNFLWVGTDQGLYRLSGQAWTIFNEEANLPSTNVLTMSNSGDLLMIGTEAGLIQYYHGGFTAFDILPNDRVEAIDVVSPQLAFAVVGDKLYRYDGTAWTDNYSYTIRLDDDMEMLVDMASVYGIPSEREFLERRINELNQNREPDWLKEGNEVWLPLSPNLRYDVSGIAYDQLRNVLYLGTESGLLSFDGKRWNRVGYTTFVVPDPPPATVREVAAQFVPDRNEDKIDVLTQNIIEYNDLEDRTLTPGQTIYVYNSNLGSEIHSVATVGGLLYVGTEYGLHKYDGSSWEVVGKQGLNKKQVVASYDYAGNTYHATSKSVTTQTSGQTQVAFMHVNWLPSLADDLYYEFFSAVHNFKGIGTLGANITFLSYGSIQRTDESGREEGTFNPYDLSLAVSYGTSIGHGLKWGLTGKLIISKLSEQGAGQEVGEGSATGFAIDTGILWRLSRRLQFGAMASNLGPDISYIDAAQSDPLPRNLAVGFAYKLIDTDFNSVLVQAAVDKPLTNSNFDDIIQHVGAEYWYAQFIALRAGYKNDNAGNLKHLTFGAGLRYSLLQFDFAYIPSSEDSPLANTLRISLSLLL